MMVTMSMMMVTTTKKGKGKLFTTAHHFRTDPLEINSVAQKRENKLVENETIDFEIDNNQKTKSVQSLQRERKKSAFSKHCVVH